MNILGYKLSKDKKGLLAYFKDLNGEMSFYHIHSDELTKKQVKLREGFGGYREPVIDRFVKGDYK